MDSLCVAGSMNVTGDISVLGGILVVDGDLVSQEGAGGIICRGVVKVGGNIRIGFGHLRAAVVDCVGNVEVAGNILVMFTLRSKKDITSKVAIVAGLQIEAEWIQPGEGYKVFAGVTAGNKEENACLREINAENVFGAIGHGIIKKILTS